MTTDTLTLTAFLLARIEEDEAAANAVHGDGAWTTESRAATPEVSRWNVVSIRREFDHAVEQVAEVYMEYPFGAERTTAEHIARHDPARVLAECAAKRAILRQHDAETFDEEPLPWDAWHCGDCGNLMPCPTLRYLAAVYAGHDDYRAEWAL